MHHAKRIALGALAGVAFEGREDISRRKKARNTCIDQDEQAPKNRRAKCE